MNLIRLRSSCLCHVVSATSLLALSAAAAQSPWLGHDRNRPLPPVVDPGWPSTPDQVGKAPSDAIMLFAGGDLTAWCAMNGETSKWVVRDAAMECVPGAGYIRTKQAFGACQLHLEFATPAKVDGRSQGRGNSGVFFGMGRYEIQVLDSYENKTYADGSAGSIYNQFPPLVNASRPPGTWQTYDIVWTPPQFAMDGQLLAPARVTVLHNGVLVQNNVELLGETSWLWRPPYRAHPEKLPIALQDHGNPVRYRNVWVRELDAGRPEFVLPDATLDRYAGTYDGAEIVRRDTNLILKFGGVDTVLFAGSPTQFFAKVVDIQVEFEPDGSALRISVGEDGGHRRERK